MRLLLAILLFPIISGAQIGWTNLAANQGVSFTDAQTCPTGKKLPIPTSNQLMTKSDVTTYFNNDATNSGFSAKASNQIVSKQDITSLTFNKTAVIYFLQYVGCVISNTKIQTDLYQERYAKYLKVGDSVFTKSETTNKWGKYRINFVNHSMQQTLSIYVGKQVLTSSFTHKVETRFNGYKEVQSLTKGDWVNVNYQWQRIDSLSFGGLKEVVELSIENAHTYIANGFLSHNKSTWPDGWTTAASACGGANNSQIVYYNGAAPANGTQLYADAAGTSFLVNDIAKYFRIGSNTFNASVGAYNSVDGATFTISNFTACGGSNVLISVNANTPASTSISGDVKFFYSVDGGTTWNIFSTYTNLGSTSTQVGSFNVSSGATVLIAVQTGSGTNIQFGLIGVSYNAYCGKTNPYNMGSVTSPTTVNLGVNVSGSLPVAC